MVWAGRLEDCSKGKDFGKDNDRRKRQRPREETETAGRNNDRGLKPATTARDYDAATTACDYESYSGIA